MINDQLFTIILTSFVWIITIVILFFYKKNKRLSEIDNLMHKNESFNKETKANEELKYQKKKNKILAKVSVEKQKEYDKGFSSASDKSNFQVEINTFKDIAEKNGWFKKIKEYEVGYTYGLFVNGYPVIEPKKIILAKIKETEIKEENVKKLLNKIDRVISKIPNPNLVIGNSVKNFGKSLLKLKK